MQNIYAPAQQRDVLISVYRQRHQRGTALIISLVFLLLLTILGVTAVSTSTLQEKMAGNMKDQNMAFQAAETGLRGGEAAILALVSTGDKPVPDSTGSGGVFTPSVINMLNSSWRSANATLYGSFSLLYEAPRYAVEFAGVETISYDIGGSKPPDTITYYRIWSHGYGGTQTAESVLQSTYKVP